MPMSRKSIRKVTATARREANIALTHHIKGHMWTVWYYELATRTNKVFKVNRISNVEIKSERWENETHHRQGKMDIFRMTGDTPVDVKLQLSLMAKNILVESILMLRGTSSRQMTTTSGCSTLRYTGWKDWDASTWGLPARFRSSTPKGSRNMLRSTVRTTSNSSALKERKTLQHNDGASFSLYHVSLFGKDSFKDKFPLLS